MGLSAAERRLKNDALAIARAALAAAEAGSAIARNLKLTREKIAIAELEFNLSDYDRIFALCVGKAAGAMAVALEEAFGERLSAGLAITKHKHATVALTQTRMLEAGHPVPDEAGVRAAAEVDTLLRELNARDLLLVGVSGGASALLPAPAQGITLAEKQETTRLLLQSGASISELNAVRKHISTLKGGRLAALAYPATVVGLLLSDVIGDPIDVIGSGLTAPDDSLFSDAIEILRRRSLWAGVPRSVRVHLQAGKAGAHPETPKSSDPIFAHVHNLVIGSNRLALAAAKQQAEALGYQTLVLTSTLSGEARDVAGVHAAILSEMRRFGSPLSAPACLLSGGETTVTVRGHGTGGRNQEFALAASLGLNRLKDVLLLSLGTDGTDGPTDAAGAWATGTTLRRAAALGLKAQQYLVDNNSYPFFAALGDLVKTGPTGTNVMDINVLLLR